MTFNTPAYYLEGILDVTHRDCYINRAITRIRDEMQWDYDFIAVKGISGIMFGSMISMTLRKSLCVIRKDESTHSHNKTVELPNGLTRYNYIICDDLIDSGETVCDIICKIQSYANNYSLPIVPRCVGIYLYHQPESQMYLSKARAEILKDIPKSTHNRQKLTTICVDP